jgi:hypothetical protein
MSSYIYTDIGIEYPIKEQGTTVHELMKNSLTIQNPSKKSKNSESNKNLNVKKNINVYIPLQTMFPSRGCL